MIVSVYRITNLINGKTYIGVSKHPELRFKQHNKASLNLLINKALRKYKPNNFKLDILCQLPNYELAYGMEVYCIRRYGSLIPNGYNLTEGGVGSVGASKEVKKKMSKSSKERMDDPEYKKRFIEATFSKEANKKRSNTVKELWKDPVFREKQRKACVRTPEQIVIYTASNRKKAEDPAFIETLKKAWEKRDRNKQSEKLKAAWGKKGKEERAAVLHKAWETRRKNAESKRYKRTR